MTIKALVLYRIDNTESYGLQESKEFASDKNIWEGLKASHNEIIDDKLIIVRSMKKITVYVKEK